MGLIPRETQSNINQALRYLASIDKSLGRIADALEEQNEQRPEALEKQIEAVLVKHYTELGPIAEPIPEVRTAEWYDDHNE